MRNAASLCENDNSPPQKVNAGRPQPSPRTKRAPPSPKGQAAGRFPGNDASVEMGVKPQGEEFLELIVREQFAIEPCRKVEAAGDKALLPQLAADAGEGFG